MRPDHGHQGRRKLPRTPPSHVARRDTGCRVDQTSQKIGLVVIPLTDADPPFITPI